MKSYKQKEEKLGEGETRKDEKGNDETGSCCPWLISLQVEPQCRALLRIQRTLTCL